MPIVGTDRRRVTSAATGAGTASSTTEKHRPLRARARRRRAASRASAVLPWVLNPPSIVADCGVRPTWPMTGMPASTIDSHAGAIGPAPSSLTASAPASLTKRIAFSTAFSSETWNEPNGMSPTTIGCRAARATVRVRKSISSIVTGHRRALVAEDDHRGRVADEDDVDARVLGEPRAGRVVGGDHHDLLAAPLHLRELGQRQLALGRCAHFGSPSRTTLSIKRVLPTRTAAASTRWPSKSATST